MLHAFAVADDLSRQRAANIAQGALEVFAHGRQRHAGLAAREQQDGIIGGSVAVNRDVVKAFLHRAAQGAPELCRSRCGVGEDVNEHRGHAGMDHARAFGHAGQSHRGPPAGEGFDGNFLARVRGHDGAGKGVKSGRTGSGGDNQEGKRCNDLLRRQRHADDPGGRREDSGRVHIKNLRELRTDALYSLNTLLAGGAIGVARIDDERLHASSRRAKMIAAHRERRSDHLIAREHGRGGGAVRRERQPQVRFAAGFDSGAARSEKKSLRERGVPDTRGFRVAGCKRGAHAPSLTRGMAISRSRCPFCGITPRYMAISSQQSRLGQCTQSL